MDLPLRTCIGNIRHQGTEAGRSTGSDRMTRKKSVALWPALLIVAIVIPWIGWNTVPSFPAFFATDPVAPSSGFSGGTSFADSRLPLTKVALGGPFEIPPLITNVQITDFDGDGISDIVACDVVKNAVVWQRQSPLGTWQPEQILLDDLVAPAHVTVVDLNQDGSLDVVVSVLGNLWPDDGVVGSVVWGERVGDTFVRHVILDDVRRVADVQAGDLDGDGDLDLAVAVFGYARGEILWLENLGGGGFREHFILEGPGAIHVPLADFDGDGDLDIATGFSQEDEELYGLENLGSGRFAARLLFRTMNYDLGSAGLVKCDLDLDGDVDLLLPCGDNLEDRHAYPQPYHGCLWFENQGSWKFEGHRIANFGGTYAAAPGDLDADGDVDVVLVSMTNDWERPENPSIVWLENDGQQNFQTWQIAGDPIHLVTVACGNLNNDNRDDIVAGGLHLGSPFERLGRITAWLSSADQIRPDVEHHQK